MIRSPSRLIHNQRTIKTMKVKNLIFSYYLRDHHVTTNRVLREDFRKLVF